MLPEPLTPPDPPRSQFHGLSFALALMNGLGILAALLGVLALGLLGGVSLLNPDSSAGAYTLGVLGWTSAAVAVLLLPGLVYAVRRLSGREKPAWSVSNPRKVLRFLIVLWPLLLGASLLAARSNFTAWLVLAPLQILVVGIPLWFFLEFGRRKLTGARPQQEWGVFSTGAVITMPLVFVLETITVIVVVSLAANAIWGQAALAEELNRLAVRITSSNYDPEVIQRALLPLLQKPAVLFTILMVSSGLVPLLEEFFKPLGMWALSNKKLSPAQGFNLGMISGAAFALLESLGYLAAPAGSDTPLMAMARVGSGLLHVTCSGLVGWGLAEAWTNGRYGRMVAAYFAAVALHGAWNLFGLLVGVVPFIDVTAGLVGFLRGLGVIAPYALGLMVLLLGGILFSMNLRLRREAAPAAITIETNEPVIPDPAATPAEEIPVPTGDTIKKEEYTDGTH